MENHQTMEQKRAVWQRVNPALQPYPADAAQDAVNVCCMGVNAQQEADVIRGFIEEELSDRRGYLTYAMPGGSWAYTILSPARSIARRCRSQGRDAFPPGGKFYVCDTTRRAAGA